jgi:hydrogenase small subunit
MSLSRREFIKIMGGGAAVLAFPGVLVQGCKKALEKMTDRANVIWIQAQSCSGCSVSLLNKVYPDIASVITEHVSLNYHQTLMAATGHVAIEVLEDAVARKRKDYVLIVEGSIPVKDDLYCTIGEVKGHHVSAREWIEQLGKNAMAVVAVGTCATAGGIPGAKSRATGDNPTGAMPLSHILPDRTIINIGGCPPHPDWIVGTLLHLLLKGMPRLDEQNRPLMYFGKTVHEQCEHLKSYRQGRFARHWGDDGCLYNLGCLGMDTGCDIPVRKFNDGSNSCTGSGAGCIGCTENVFPDYGTRGIFKHLNAGITDIKSLHPESAQVIMKLKNGGVING